MNSRPKVYVLVPRNSCGLQSTIATTIETVAELLKAGYDPVLSLLSEFWFMLPNEAVLEAWDSLADSRIRDVDAVFQQPPPKDESYRSVLAGPDLIAAQASGKPIVRCLTELQAAVPVHA